MKFDLCASARTGSGRSAARRLRRAGQVPGIVYGLEKPRSIQIEREAIARRLQQEAFHSSLIELSIDGAVHRVLLRETQVHPVDNRILHIDFQAIADDKPIAASVPLHFVNADSCPGIKLHHGIFSIVMAEVNIHCLPRNLPESIEVDAGGMEIGQNLHLSDLPQVAGVTFDALQRSENPVLAAVHAPRKEEAAESKPADEAAAEPAPGEDQPADATADAAKGGAGKA